LGTVIAFKEDKIDIQFAGGTKSFVFPDAIENGYLKIIE